MNALARLPGVLCFVTGAGGSGKSSILPRLDAAFDFAWHEFDSIGVPQPTPPGGRLQAIEHWVARAADAGGDYGIVGQVPLGEILAVPSAARLDGIAVCLLETRQAWTCSGADGRRGRQTLRRGDVRSSTRRDGRSKRWRSA